MNTRKYSSKHSWKISALLIRKVLPAALSLVMVAGTASPAFAVGNASEKEEVIYVNLDAGGSVKDVYAVNIFGVGDIIDYGDYSSVEMLNTTDPIEQNGDCITFSTSADRVYYKGTMKNTVIPWSISIRYFLDGTRYSAAEIKGKSGKLEIRFEITKNPYCDGSFYDNYALQAAFALDTKRCKNITADDAAIANAGSKKQLTYTILPGEGIDTVITADVTDFEMDAVSINGIPLCLNIEVDDEELMDQVNDLLDAIAELDDGAGELKDGTSELQDAAREDLQSGVKELDDGAEALHHGCGELKNGSSAMADGTKELNQGAAALDTGLVSLNHGVNLIGQSLTQLNEKSDELNHGSSEILNALLTIQSQLAAVSASADEIDALVSGSSQIKTGIDSLAKGIAELENNVSFQAYEAAMKEKGLDIDELQAANAQTIQSLEEQISSLNSQIAQLKDQIAYLEQSGGNESQIEQLKDSVSQLESTANQLSTIKPLIQGNSAAIHGMDTYLTQLHAGIAELSQGAENLKNNYDSLDDGIKDMASQLKTLLVNISELKSGIDTLVAEYSKLDHGIPEYTGGVSQILAGYSEITNGTTQLLRGSSSLKQGTEELYSKTVELLNGITEIYNAAGTLKDGTGQFSDGTEELILGITELYDGTTELKDGTMEMRNETDGIDDDISEKIDEMIESITGGDSDITSFVSEKNTNVDAVQFVIQTDSIEARDITENIPDTKEELTFFQKILRLFGLY